MSNLTHLRIVYIETASSHAGSIQRDLMRYTTDLLENGKPKHEIDSFNDILSALDQVKQAILAMSELTEMEYHGFNSVTEYRRAVKKGDARIQQQSAKPMSEILTDAEAI